MKRTRTLVAGGALAMLAVLGGVAVASGSGDAEGADVAITGTALERATQAALDHVGEGRVTGTEVGDEESYYEVEVTLDDGRQVDVQLDENFAFVGEEFESEDADDADDADDAKEGADVAITGDALSIASDTALAVVQDELGQGGSVTDTEVGDEESYYEVEVTLDDGREVDVQLDEDFNFVGFD